MKKRFSKLLSLLLAVALLVQLVPTWVFATEAEQDDLSFLHGEANSVENAVGNARPEDILYEVEERREESEKHFRMKNGSFVAVQYDLPVHYQDENGEFVDIDNTLQFVAAQESGARYRSVNGNHTTEFAADLSDGMLFTASAGESSVQMGLIQESENSASPETATENTVQAQVESVATRSSGEAAVPSFYPEKLSATVLYENVYPNIDLKYEAYGYDIKESILLNAPVEQNAFVFALNLENLTPQVQNNGSILLVDEDMQPIYEIPAPYMYDAAGLFSDSVTHTLVQTASGQYQLTVTADPAFLASASYPVCIDPTLSKHSTTNAESIRSTYIISGKPDLTRAGSDPLYLGYTAYDGDGTYEAIVYAGGLPEVPNGCFIEHAEIELHHMGSSCDGANVEPMILRAHKLTLDKQESQSYEEFVEGLTWNRVHPNGTANYDSTVLDFAKIGAATEGTYVSLDITACYEEWQSSENHCLLLRTDASASKAMNAWFHTYKQGISFMVSYRNDVGIEDYYTYRTLGAGRAGTVAISDHTHRLTLTNTLINAPSNVMPFSMSLVYNSSQGSRYFDNNEVEIHARDYSEMKIGAGWKLTAQQCLQSVRFEGDSTNTLYWVYTDGDGTEHYFKCNEEETEASDEDGLDLTARLVEGEAGHTNFEIESETGYKAFFRDGIITSETDAYGNAIYYCYNDIDYSETLTSWQPTNAVSNRLTKIYRKNSGSTYGLEMLAELDYTADGFLSTVKNEAGLIATMHYDTINGVKHLVSVEYPDHEESNYSYSDGILEQVYDAEGDYGLSFDCTAQGQVLQYQEYYLGDTESQKTGAVVSCWNGNGKRCTYRDWGQDRIKETADDLRLEMVFDEFGQTVCTYVTNNDNTEVYGSSAVDYFDNEGQNPTNHKITSASSAGMTAVNLLPDGSMELNSAANWENASSGSASAAVRDVANGQIPRNGSYGLKFWRSTAAEPEHTAAILHSGITLQANKTYTLSAYVRADSQTVWGENGCLKIKFLNSSGGTAFEETVLTTKPSSNIEDGWQRVYASFTPNTNGSYRPGFYFSNFQNLLYIDDVQLEAAQAPSTFNLVQNGSFEYGLSHWEYASTLPAILYESTSTPFGDQVVRINAKETEYIRMKQVIPMNCSSDITFQLSGWARGSSAPNPSDEYGDVLRYFGLILRIDYADGSMEFHSVPFEATVQSWQYAAKSIVPQKSGVTIADIQVFCAYDNNHNKAYFDNISLRMEPVRRYEYDENGKPKSSEETGVEEEGYLYEGADLMSFTSSNGVEYDYTYYEDKHSVKTATVDGVTTSYAYDDAGNGTSAVMKDSGNTMTLESSSTATSDKNHTRHVYDANGNKASYTYSAYTGNVLSITTYPDRDPTTNADGEGIAVSNTYDNKSNRITSTQQGVYWNAESEKWEPLVQICYQYDKGSVSNLQRRSTQNGTNAVWQKYAFEKNAWGQETAITVSGGNGQDSYTATITLAEREYAPNNGHLTKEYFGDSDHADTDYVSYTYDIFDRITRIDYNSGRYITNVYNAEGNLAKLSYGDGTTEKGSYTFEYDALGRLIRSNEYDGNGKLVQRTEQLYDEHSRLKSQNWVIGETEYSESYTYNDPREENSGNQPQDGSLATVTTATGDVLDYDYDKLKRLEQVQVQNAEGTAVLTTRYAYGSLGGTRSTNEIQYRNVRLGENGTILEGKKYSYDGVGNIIEIAQSTSPFYPEVRYEYDDYNQLVKETYYDGNGDGAAHVTDYYDYTYDTAGNILSVSKNGTQIKTYSYTNAAWKDMLTGVNGLAIAYEGQTYSISGDVEGTAVSGNPIYYRNGTTAERGNYPVEYYMEWSNGRQLTYLEVWDDTQTRIQYAYDSDGIRTSKSVEYENHSYITQNGKVVRETIGSGSTAKVLDFIYDSSGSPFALIYTNGTAAPVAYYYVLNLQGDVVKLVTANGVVAALYRYNAWGEILEATGEMAEINPLRYRGYYYDTETGFYYLQSRYYDPAMHRFINADVFTSTGQGFIGHNMFAYCGNEPIQNADYGGLLWTGTTRINDGGYKEYYITYDEDDAMAEAFVENLVESGIHEASGSVLMSVEKTSPYSGSSGSDFWKGVAELGVGALCSGVPYLAVLLSVKGYVDLGYEGLQELFPEPYPIVDKQYVQYKLVERWKDIKISDGIVTTTNYYAESYFIWWDNNVGQEGVWLLVKTDISYDISYSVSQPNRWR